MAKYFEDLIVWQKAMDLVIEAYRLIRFLPKEETYAPADQLRRSAVSIPFQHCRRTTTGFKAGNDPVFCNGKRFRRGTSNTAFAL